MSDGEHIESVWQRLEARQHEILRLRAALREVYEVWAGSDGMVPETAPEAYQGRLILQMRDAATRGLGITADQP